MLRVKAILTRRALVDSNALLQRCAFGAIPQEQATTGSSMRLGKRTCTSLSESVRIAFSQSNRSFVGAAEFERIWWDKGSDSRNAVSIWQPKPPPGFAVLGVCLVECLEPPRFGVGLLENETGTLTKPTKYLPWVHISGVGLEDVYIWFPVAPAGYVAVGCVATRTQQMPPVDLGWCIRTDSVTVFNFSKRPFWSMCIMDKKCSLWKVETQAHTFIAQPNLERPPDRVAKYLGIGNRNCRDGSTADTRDNVAADKHDKQFADKRYSSTANKRTSSTFNGRGSSINEGLIPAVLLGLGSLFLLNQYIPLAKLIFGTKMSPIVSSLALKCGRFFR